jgi:hypothetical protein
VEFVEVCEPNLVMPSFWFLALTIESKVALTDEIAMVIECNTQDERELDTAIILTIGPRCVMARGTKDGEAALRVKMGNTDGFWGRRGVQGIAFIMGGGGTLGGQEQT